MGPFFCSFQIFTVSTYPSNFFQLNRHHYIVRTICTSLTTCKGTLDTILAINKEDTTFLYAMFVYNARREDWIQENDVSVFANLRIRPSTRIRIRIG